MNEQNTEHGGSAQITRLHRGRPADQTSAWLRAPRSLAETGLPPVFVGRLALKSTLLNGKSHFSELSERHKLPIAVLEDVLAFLVRERLAEITHRGATDIDVHFRLTEAGRTMAVDEISRCSYCGPAPVSYESYIETVREHSVRRQRITQADVRTAFRDVRIERALLDSAAASLNAGRPLMLYGPAGSGKTFLAERLGLLLQGDVPIPYALYVGGEIVQMYDPLLHHDAPAADGAAVGDKRWRLCRRPMVLSGGELTLEGLDLRYDSASGFYQAPPHMKANMGLYIVDDLGRQRIAAQDLLNRWIMPLDRGIDLFTLQSGARFTAPFDVWPVFSTNLDPAAIGDDAFLRRLGSKLHMGPLSLESYQFVFEACCATLGLATTQAAFDYLLHELHMPTGKPFLACYPRDLLSLISASVDYRGTAREVTGDGLREAWNSYFATTSTESNSRYPPTDTRPDKKYAAS
ncbi:YifB family Mg chelatase-like AAA ATPase [Trinickia fusca]|uniref:ATP-binding protein n=1 Tax=Trinickia fusca TaxID=2419777 RepID=A0A494WZE1_9BURK|nr:YifB family Mg chelatase-like AAA ATPase [Trinickia fusca]RKP43895.1 ATP-binding protein [Trinickia fusca]